MKTRHLGLTLLAVCGCMRLAGPAAAEQIKATEIRQNLFSACFFSEKDGWVVGELGRILHTTDGGETFGRTPMDTRTAFLSVTCLPDGSVVTTGQHGVALRSRDGAHWEKLTTGTDRNLLSVDFADENVGVAVGDYGTIVRTSDAGATWSEIPLPAEIPLPEDIAEIIEPGDVLLYDVHFVTPEQAWIVGEFGVVLTTRDGGRSWSAQKSGVETTLFGVDFTDPQHGWAVGIENVMLRTTDGGETWERQDVPSERGFVLALYDVDVSGQFGWAIGDSGLLLHSTDGGATWLRVKLPIQLAANWFRGISLTADAAGMIVGSEGLLLTVRKDEYRQLQKGAS